MRRALVSLLSVCALLLCGRALAQPAPREDVLLQRSEQLVARGQNERAARLLARSVRGPDSARARARAAPPSDALLDRFAELALPCALPAPQAEEQARASAELLAGALAKRAEADPLPPSLALSAAWGAALRDQFAESQALFAAHARADAPRTLLCLRAVAALALRRGRTEVARSVLNLARGFAPSDPELASELAMVALAEGDSESALTALAERFAQDPGSLLARRDLAYALSAAGRPAEGFALLSVVAGACGSAPTCLLERARWAFEAGMVTEALAAARLLLEREPQHLDGLFLAADALLAQGELEQARLMYLTILRIAPDNLRAKNALSGLAR